MQLNKPNKKASKKSKVKEEGLTSNPYRTGSSSSSLKQDKKEPTTEKKTEDHLIDLYDDPYKKNQPENDEVIINIDFTKPAELLGKLYQKIKEWLHVAKRNINVDFIRSIKFSSKRERRRSFKILGGSLAVLLVGWLTMTSIFGGGEATTPQPDPSQVQGVSEGTENIITQDAPDFELLYPNERTINDYESLGIVSPPGAPLAYAFLDSIDQIGIQVSQQEIPEALQTNQNEELKTLAEGFLANEAVPGEDFKAYVGLNRPGGPQSVVAIKNDRLIFIKTDSEIEIESLSIYLESLQ